MALTTTPVPTTAAPAPVPPRPRRRVDRTHYLFLLPTVAAFTLFITLPAAMGIFFSFTNSVGYGAWDFVGVANYALMLTNPAILASYGFTPGFAAATVVVTNLIAFLLAVGLTSQIRARVFLRAVFVIPMVVSAIIIAYVFNFLFSKSLPAAAQAVGFGPLEESILANPDLAWLSIVLVTAWPGHHADLHRRPRRHTARTLRGLLARRRQRVAADQDDHPAAHGRLRRHQRDPDVQELPQRLRRHHRPDRGRPRHVDALGGHDNLLRLRHRRLRLPDGERHHLLPHCTRDRTDPAAPDARKGAAR